MSDFGGGPTATGRLIIDASAVASGVDQATGSLSRIGPITGSTYFGLRNLGLGFDVVGTAALGAVAASVTAAAGWESAMARIQATTQDANLSAQQNAAAMNGISDGLKNIAATSPFAISSITQVAQAIAEQGIRGRAVIADTQAILDLNRLTGVSYTSLVPGITKLTQLYGQNTNAVMETANALLFLDQHTTASITDTLNLTQRIAGIGAASGLTAPQVLGLSSSISSIPNFSRQAGTAVAGLLQTIDQAANTTGRAQDTIARALNMTGDQFALQYGKRPGEAIGPLIEQLGRLSGNLVEQEGILTNLGIKQQAQQRAIIGWADAQKNLVGTSNEVTAAMDGATQAAQRNADLQKEMGTITNTFSSQMALLHNNVTLMAQSFGAVLLPVLTPAVRAFSDLAAGIASAPEPLKIFIGVAAIAVGVVGTLGGTFLILLPRILQAQEGLQRLAMAHAQAAMAEVEHTAAMERLTAAQQFAVTTAMIQAQADGLDAAATRDLVAAELMAGGATAEEAAAIAALVVPEATATAATGLLTLATDALAAAIDFALGPFGILMALMGIAAVIIAKHGMAMHNAADSANNMSMADQTLMDAMKGLSGDVVQSTNEWILNKLAMDGTLESLVKVGITADEVANVIKTGGTTAELQKITKALEDNGHMSASQAAKIVDDLRSVRQTYTATQGAVDALAQSNQQLGTSADGAGSASQQEAAQITKVKDAASAAADAASRLVDANVAVSESQDRVASAQAAEAKAAEDLAHQSLAIQTATDQLSADNASLADEQSKLASAEQQLANARQQDAVAVQQASDDLVSAQLREQDSVLKVADAQQKLNDLESGGLALELAKAVNDAADAHIKLVNAEQGAADAQYQLNLLQEPGHGGARDLAGAETTLADANQKVADAQTDAAEKQQKLNDVRQSQPNELIKATLDLKQAQNDERVAAETTQASELKLADARANQASDKSYHDAQKNLADAHLAVDNAEQRIIDDTDKLNALRAGSLDQAYKKAQDDLTKAYYDQAKAEADLQVQQDALNGHVDDTNQKTYILGQHLFNLGAQIGGPVGAALQAMGTQMMTDAGSAQSLAAQAQVAADKTSSVGDAASKTSGALDGMNSASARSHSAMGLLTTDVGGLLKPLQDLYDFATGKGPKLTSFFTDLLKAAGLSALGPAGPGVLGLLDKVGIHLGAVGGLFTSPTLTLIGEAGPELLLPLNDDKRMMQLINQAGLTGKFASMNMSQTAPMSGYASLPAQPTSVVHQGGDTFPISIMNGPTPEEVIAQATWNRMIRTRG